MEQEESMAVLRYRVDQLEKLCLTLATKEEIRPLRLLVGGFIGVVMTGFIGSILFMIWKGA